MFQASPLGTLFPRAIFLESRRRGQGSASTCAWRRSKRERLDHDLPQLLGLDDLAYRAGQFVRQGGVSAAPLAGRGGPAGRWPRSQLTSALQKSRGGRDARDREVKLGLFGKSRALLCLPLQRHDPGETASRHRVAFFEAFAPFSSRFFQRRDRHNRLVILQFTYDRSTSLVPVSELSVE